MDRGFVITDERLRTNLPDVYAVGDIVPGLQLAHRGFQQGIFVAEEIAGLNPRGRSTTTASRGSPTATRRSPRSASPRPQASEQYGADDVETYIYNLGGNGKSADPQDRRRRQGGPGRRTARSSACTWSAAGSAS